MRVRLEAAAAGVFDLRDLSFAFAFLVDRERNLNSCGETMIDRSGLSNPVHAAGRAETRLKNARPFSTPDPFGGR